jgi:hypothetical protein
MGTALRRYLKWLRYSGASVAITVNPWHWSWIPRAQRELNDTWSGPNERTWSVRWLFLTARIWIDDGSW